MADPSGWIITPPANTGGWEITQPHQVGGWSIAPPSEPSLLGRIENAALAVPREIGAEIEKQKAGIARRQNIARRMFGTPAQRASVTPAERTAERHQVVSTASGLAGTQDLAAGPISEAAGAVAKDLVPAVRTADGLKVGKVGDNHDTIVPNAPEKDRGFVRQSEPTKFLSRKQAAKLTPEVAGTAPLGKGKPESLSSEDLNASEGTPQHKPEPPPTPEGKAVAASDATPAKEGALSHAPALGKPRQMEDQLFQLRNLEVADRMDARDALTKLPSDYTPELDEKLYHHEEDPSIKLTPHEQAIYDEHVKPLKAEATALARELDGLTGIKTDLNEIYTPRYVAGRTRSYGEALAQWFKGVEARFGGAGTRTMRKTVDAQKGRDFFIAEHPDTGQQSLVFVAPDRQVFSFDGTPQPKPFGRLAGTGGPRSNSIVRSLDGDQFRLSQATTKQIEGLTKTRYVKSVMANRLDNLAKLRAAVRNAKYIEAMKADPQWSEFFKPAAETPVPPVTNGRAWRRPVLPQFSAYLAEPAMADALDDFARSTVSNEDINAVMHGLTRFVNGMMFLNPLPHERNILNWALVTRGLAGNVIHMPSEIRNLARAFQEVRTGGPIYRRAIKAGLSLPYSRMIAGDLHDTLIRRLGIAAKENPRGLGRIAARLGYKDTKTMLWRWAQIPNRILWASQDVTTLQRMLELMDRGMPIEKAISRTHAEVPSYRVPGQVLTKGKMGRVLADVFNNPAVGRFGRYQYNRFQIYADMLKKAFGGNVNLADRAHAFDQLLMLGVYTFLVYPLYDKLWQTVTGNPHAQAVRAGASAILGAVQQAAQGQKQWGDLMQTTFTMGLPLELASDLYYGRYGWSGQPIIRDPDVRAAFDGDTARQKQIARDIGSFALSFFPILDVVMPPYKQTRGQTMLRDIGVQSPSERQVEERQKYRQIENVKSARRAGRANQ